MKRLKTRRQGRGESDNCGQGWPWNVQISYLPTHPKHEMHQRVLRTAGHNTLPDIVGPFFLKASGDNPDLYFASILALLRPWRTITDIKRSEDSFTTAFQLFYKST